MKRGGSGAQIAAMEIRDVVQLTFAAAGWGLAAFQYWRNELSKRPLVLMEVDGAGGTTMIGVTIRNRGPADIYVHRLVIIEPEGAVAAAYDRSSYAIRTKGRAPLMQRGAAIDLDIHLKAFSSGSFPSRSLSLTVEKLDPNASSIVCGVDISASRDTTASKRFMIRQSIKRKKSNEVP